MDLSLAAFTLLLTIGLMTANNAGAAPQNPYQYILQARFNMGGIKGAVMFQQKTVHDLLEIKVQFDKLQQEGYWGVHSNPVIYNGGASDSCNSDIVGSLVQDGNLTLKHSNFTYKAVYNNDKLKAFGKNSILGASLVMIHPVTFSLWGCATILPFNTTVVYATAVFKGTIAGKVQFIQDSNNSTSEVAIIGDLYYTDGQLMPSDNHEWYISSLSAPDSGICAQLTTVFRGNSISSGSCSIHQPEACYMGDLSSKLNNISVGIANVASKSRKFRLIDTNLNVASVIGHALVIRNTAGVPVACANIVKNGPMSMSAKFESAKHDGVSGSVSFSQQSPYHPTVIQYNLNGLASKASGIHVHQFPIPMPEPSSPCSGSAVGNHLNPYGINNKAASYPADGSGATLDNYEVGDISGKFGNLSGISNSDARYVDDQMDMYGRYSILNRALVIHRNDASGSRWICSNVDPDNISKWLSATANFSITSDLIGTVTLKQHMLSDGIITDTGLTVQLAYTDPAKSTNNHNWHVHIEPVGSDGKAVINERCKSVGPHYNPYKVDVNNPAYASECSAQTPYRCELGDLNGKQAKYDIGAGKKYFVDVNTPLFGAMSVIGRSITFHTENAGAPRLACADIIPDSIAAVSQIEHSYPEAVPFNKTLFKDIIVKALAVKNWQVHVMKSMAYKKPCNKIVFYVIDMQPSGGTSYKTKFQDVVKNHESKLGKYKHCMPKTAGNSLKTDPSFTAVVLSIILFFVFTRK